MSEEKVLTLRDLIFFVRHDFASRRVEFRARQLLNPVVRFTILLRIHEYLLNRRMLLLGMVVKIWFRSLSIKLGFSIPPHVFGPGLCIVHYGTIVVNPAARIGKNCRMHACVNIGGSGGFVTSEEAMGLSPRIGDDCYIGPGAKIFGPVTIADRCKIGANAVVNKSFLIPGSTIVGVPAHAVNV